MDKFYTKRPVNPIFTIITAIIITFYGLATAGQDQTTLFLLLVFCVLIIFGYTKTLLHLLKMLAILLIIFVSISYISKRDQKNAYYAFCRVFTLYLSVSLSISIAPIRLVKVMKSLKFSKKITLGSLVTFSFMPKLYKELKQIRLAKKTRAVNRFNPKNIYRATVFPFMARLVDISEILALSIETRGFNLDKNAKSTIYNKIKIEFRDILFMSLMIIIFSVTIYLNVKGVNIFGQ